MRFSSLSGAALTAVAFYGQQAWAQAAAVMLTDPSTNITFPTWSDDSGYTFGFIVAPEALTTDTYEYIGYLSCTTPEGEGAAWCGISHGTTGQMAQSLLLVAWPYESEVLTSFRYATGYTAPDVYTGDATLSILSSSVDATSFTIVYRCQDCWRWDQNGATGSVSTSGGSAVLGRAAADEAPGNPGCPDDITIPYHSRAFGQYGAPFSAATASSYAAYATMATVTTTGAASCQTTAPGGNGTATATATASATATATAAPTCQTVPSNKTFDYVIVGAGAGGIPVADKLSEAGASVLLVEKGPVSTGQWGGTLGPDWIKSQNLTRFDVPGLCNEIWVDSTGIACTDTDQMAGCILGGGTAINAGLWWKPNPQDFDENFPSGWQYSDIEAATERVFERIPGTWHPSQDGKVYMDQGFNALASGLNASGWEYVIPNESPDRKNRTFGHTTYMYSNGERGGPLATYLATAVARSDVFTLWTDTAVDRIVRNGSLATGVDVACSADGGYAGTVQLTPGTGRVVVSAGSFGSPKLLLRSGIGPTDQLNIVKNSTDGSNMIGDASWINLPVGYNLVEQMNTDAIVIHPDVVSYDFYGAWDEPIESDMMAYLGNRTGILTQAAPNIGPMMWEEITASDGSVRQLQYTSRVEGSSSVTKSKNAMTISQYLGRGQVSRGRTTISTTLDMTVSTAPFFNDADGHDKEAVIAGLESLQAALSTIPNLTWVQPAANQTAREYVDSLLVTANARTSNHWMGTCKMGTDDGRVDNGTAVVDTDARVWGTDNIFVVDASIFPGQLTGNPSASIVTAAEHAAERILALETGSGGSGTLPSSSGSGSGDGSYPMTPIGGGSTNSTATGSSSSSSSEETCRRRRRRGSL